MTTRYHNSKIYKLVNTADTRIYVGSTCLPLSKRLWDHKLSARHNPARKVYEALNTVGWENVRIVQIEAFRCENKQELVAREQYFIDLLRPSLNMVASSGQRCEHGRVRCLCKECGGVSICEHGIRIAKCKECGGSQICEHDRRRDQCKKCGGSQICEHNKNRICCKECGGSQVCEHGRQRSHCKDCSPAECDFCGITTTKGDYDRHCRSATHKRNESEEFLRVFGFPMND
jgi:hypothetical protein